MRIIRRHVHRVIYHTARAHRRLKNSFIPREGNYYRPHALRSPALRTYSVLLILAKIGISGFLFLIYPNEGSFSALTAARMLELTNASRLEVGVPQLVMSTKLITAASAKAGDMLAKGYFAHTNPEGKQFFQWIRDAGYSYSLAGENLAKDFSSAESAQKALIASELHRKNIVNPKFRDIGLAVVAGTLDSKETYVLVELFGAPPTPKPIPQIAVQKPQPKPETQPQPEKPKPVPVKPVPEQPTPEKPVEQPAPKFLAALTEQSHRDVALTTNQAVSVTVAFQNVGTATWETPIELVAQTPEGSVGIRDATWLSADVAARAVEATVLPGGVAHFVFSIRAAKGEGDVQERFVLFAGGKAVEQGTTSLAATVTSPQLTVANPTAFAAPSAQPEVAGSVIAAGSLTEKVTAGALVANFLARNPDLPFWIFLGFLLTAFFLNVFIRIRQQNAHLIGQTILVLVLTGVLIVANFHFLERVSTNLIVR